MKYLALLIVCLVILNLLVTVKVVKNASFTSTQKLLQAIMIWLLPFFGAIAIYLFHRSEDGPKGPDKPKFGGGHGESVSVISAGEQ